MLLFVDTEHASGYDKPWADRLQAARTRITYRLEDLTGDDVHLVRYDRVDRDLIERLDVRGLFLSGSSVQLDDYGEERSGLFDVITDLDLPMFGFCGGLQMMAVALGVEVARIGELAAGEDDPNPDVQPGMKKEYGYQPVPITVEHPMLDGMGGAPIMRQAHSWELKTLPPGFDLHASTDVTPIQLVIHRDRPIIGTQFHPEYWTDEHPAGRVLIENFCRVAGLGVAADR